MSATVILAKMEELAPTVMEVIHAAVKMDGQAMIVPKFTCMVLIPNENLLLTPLRRHQFDYSALGLTRIPNTEHRTRIYELFTTG